LNKYRTLSISYGTDGTYSKPINGSYTAGSSMLCYVVRSLLDYEPICAVGKTGYPVLVGTVQSIPKVLLFDSIVAVVATR